MGFQAKELQKTAQHLNFKIHVFTCSKPQLLKTNCLKILKKNLEKLNLVLISTTALNTPSSSVYLPYCEPAQVGWSSAGTYPQDTLPTAHCQVHHSLKGRSMVKRQTGSSTNMHMTMLRAIFQCNAVVARKAFKLSVCKQFKSYKLLENRRHKSRSDPFSRALLLLYVKVSAVTAEDLSVNPTICFLF